VKLTEEHYFWLRQIDRYGNLMTVVPGNDRALGWLMSSVPGRPDLIYNTGMGDLALTPAGRAALPAQERDDVR
jgi:hypothetical protein